MKRADKNTLQKLNFSILFALVICFAFAGGVVGYDIYQDRRATIIINGPVDLHEKYTKPTNKKIGNLQPSDQVQVLRIRYEKDYQAIKIQTTDGQVGWIISGGNFELR